ncbi:MAG: hypothetical protein WBN68_00140 [Sedimenticolaceae bacterium]
MRIPFNRLMAIGCAACPALSMAGTVPARADITAEVLSDTYVYLLSRALVVRQEQTDLAEDGIDHNVVKYNMSKMPLQIPPSNPC